MSVDEEMEQSKVCDSEDGVLKSITETVAYKIFEGPDNAGAELNYSVASRAVSQYISEYFTDSTSFKKHLYRLGDENKLIHQFAHDIFNYYQGNTLLSFETVKYMISVIQDFRLKKITDIVAYKIYESPEDKGPELNFISAETFVSQYISEKFKSLQEFNRHLSGLGKDNSPLELFAETVYKYYCQKKTESISA
ncbi:MAG: hypothetical protein MRJ65_01165 [Candidatus Brocadiaceae bacterium]|nr:hypothetical protein [Candidatus Brocadiaceae bacterium]